MTRYKLLPITLTGALLLATGCGDEPGGPDGDDSPPATATPTAHLDRTREILLVWTDAPMDEAEQPPREAAQKEAEK